MFVIYEYKYIARQSVFLMVETKIFINLGNDIHVFSFSYYVTFCFHIAELSDLYEFDDLCNSF